jgi:ABC-type polysaccharide/polyol phosphate transport system ATPase subunit
MNLPTESKPNPTDPNSNLAIELSNVSVRYRVPQERIPSFKEYAIRWIKGQIRYQDFWALHDINLQIQRGEVFGIIGPNGAGKSTLLKVVSRVLRPTTGHLRVRGRISPLLELGAGFDPELTGRENIYLNGAILGYSQAEIDECFDQIVEFAGLPEFIDAPVRTYSSGKYARLGFAVATMKRPEILIVDEILGVGDAEFQTKSYERIQRFQGEGTTILLVSHSLERVKELCARAIWLDHGKIIASGSADQVVDQYLAQIMNLERENLRAASRQPLAPASQWGDQKILLSNICLYDGNGQEQTIFQTGDTLILKMDYIAHEEIISPVFGVAIHRQDGAHITGPNTSLAHFEIPRVYGKGRITFKIPFLPVLEGLYQFSVAAINQDDTEMFDYHDRVYPFRVINRGGKIQEPYGMITVNGEWTHEKLE